MLELLPPLTDRQPTPLVPEQGSREPSLELNWQAMTAWTTLTIAVLALIAIIIAISYLRTHRQQTEHLIRLRQELANLRHQPRN